MNHAKKLQLLAVLGVLTISSASLVQAADIPVVSTGGATYNIGLQGWSSFTNSDNVHLGGQTGAANSDPYSHAGDPNAKGNNIAPAANAGRVVRAPAVVVERRDKLPCAGDGQPRGDGCGGVKGSKVPQRRDGNGAADLMGGECAVRHGIFPPSSGIISGERRNHRRKISRKKRKILPKLGRNAHFFAAFNRAFSSKNKLCACPHHWDRREVMFLIRWHHSPS